MSARPADVDATRAHTATDRRLHLYQARTAAAATAVAVLPLLPLLPLGSIDYDLQGLSKG